MAGILSAAGLDKTTWTDEENKRFFALMQEPKRCTKCGAFLPHRAEKSTRLPRDGSDPDYPMITWVQKKRCQRCRELIEYYI